MSRISDECDRAMTAGGVGRVLDVLRQRGPINPADTDLDAWIAKTFVDPSDSSKVTACGWLAQKLASLGAEPRWPLSDLSERQIQAAKAGSSWPAEPAGGIAADLPGSGGGPGILRAIYFPGTGQKRAMIISGVHGDELAGVEVVETLLPKLKPATFAFSIMVVPRVFAKNCAAGRRKTSDSAKDPNRQMPAVGALPGSASSAEPENQALLELIQRFAPERLVSVHGVARDNELAGITSDPRPGTEAADRKLALDMARAAAGAGGTVPGNKLGTKDETGTYPTQSRPHEEGTTLGQWGSAAAGPRPAINMILIETKGKGGTASKSGFTAKERDALVKGILDVFLK
jgi:hypothetical protein